jgi:hypothetical protein
MQGHMKKISAGIFVILFLSFFGAESYGETKFGNSDFLSQDTRPNLKNNPIPTPATPKIIPVSTQTKPSEPSPVMTQQPPSIPPLATTQTNLPSTIPPIGKTSTLKGPLDIKPVNIRAPNYDQQLQQMMQAEQPKVKKKKPLFAAILEEITNYGVFIILGLVAYILIYIVRKDMAQEKAKPADEADEPGETSPSGENETPGTKRDIWDEKF